MLLSVRKRLLINSGNSNVPALVILVTTVQGLPSAMTRHELSNGCKMCLEWAALCGTVWLWLWLTMKEKANQNPATSSVTTETAISVSGADDLPPFASLTSDEERERKAESTSPGTYNVVVNPESFHHLPEYSDDSDVKSARLSPLRRGSFAASMASSQGRDTGIDSVHQFDSMHHGDEDPNIVILRRFEDASRRATLQWKDSRSPETSRLTTLSPEIHSRPAAFHNDFNSTQSLMQRAADGGGDSDLLHHFRNNVWLQLAQVDKDSMAQASGPAANFGMEILESAARFFPPVCFDLCSRC